MVYWFHALDSRLGAIAELEPSAVNVGRETPLATHSTFTSTTCRHLRLPFFEIRGRAGAALLSIIAALAPLRAEAQASIPVITTQPISQSVNPGTMVTLSVTATGATTYQWYENSIPVGGNASTLPFSSAQTGVYSFYVVASNATGYATSSTVTLTFALIAAPAITSQPSAAATLNSPFTYSITATGLPTSFGATGLPPGLAVNPSTGVVSGSATVAGSYTVTLSATNSVGTGTLAL